MRLNHLDYFRIYFTLEFFHHLAYFFLNVLISTLTADVDACDPAVLSWKWILFLPASRF